MPSRSKCPVWLYVVIGLAVVVLIGTSVALGMNESFYTAPITTSKVGATDDDTPMVNSSSTLSCPQPQTMDNTLPSGGPCNWYNANREGAENSTCSYYELSKPLHINQKMHIDAQDLNMCTNNRCTTVESNIQNWQCQMKNKTNEAILKAQNEITSYGKKNDALQQKISQATAEHQTATLKLNELQTDIQKEINSINNLKKSIASFQTNCGCDKLTIKNPPTPTPAPAPTQSSGNSP